VLPIASRDDPRPLLFEADVAKPRPKEQFPSLKAKKLLAVLTAEPLAYEISRQKGSHRVLDSPNGYPRLGFAFHDGTTVGGGLVKDILVSHKWG
jgi:predicted RNA binding protein YcfA (HicA-like mRNA interferase family)